MAQFLHGPFPCPLPRGMLAVSLVLHGGEGRNAEFPPGSGGLQTHLHQGMALSRACFHISEVLLPKSGSLALNHLWFGGFVFSRIHSLCLKAGMVLRDVGYVQRNGAGRRGLRKVMLRRTSFLLQKPVLKAAERALKSRAGFKLILKQTPRKRASSAICTSKCGSLWAGAQEALLDVFLHSSHQTR